RRVGSWTTATRHTVWSGVKKRYGPKEGLQVGLWPRVSADEMLTQRVADQFGGALDFELGQHAGAVIVDGLDAQPEIGGDGADRFSRGDGEEDLELAPREEIVRALGLAPAPPVHDQPLRHFGAQVFVPL